MRYLILLLRFLLIALPTLSVLFFPELLDARPGGGGGFSGGGGGGGYSGGGGSYSGSSGGGGDGGGEAILWIIMSLVNLTLNYPYVMGPVWLILIAFIWRQRQLKKKKPVSSGPSPGALQLRREVVESTLETFKQTKDPNFSQTLLLEYTYNLFHEVLQQASKQRIDNLHGFVHEDILKSLKLLYPKNYTYTEIVVGSIYIYDFNSREDYDDIGIRLFVNFTRTQDGRSTRHMQDIKLTLERQAGVLTPEPEKAKTVQCPNCGAPLSLDDDHNCTFCGAHIQPGENDWALRGFHIVWRDQITTDNLLTEAPERGTNDPTVVSPSRNAIFTKLIGEHISATGDKGLDTTAYSKQWLQGFTDEVATPIFMAIYQHWDSMDWERARPYMTDRLWESMNYWIESYREHGYRNKLDDVEIYDVEFAKADIDKYYHSITIRIWAQAKDYVIDDKTGKVLKGKKNKARKFSEYWTFIKHKHVHLEAEQSVNLNECPNCGADIAMNQAGLCGYCETKVNTGEFNWVLAFIDQDEVYGR